MVRMITIFIAYTSTFSHQNLKNNMYSHKTLSIYH